MKDYFWANIEREDREREQRWLESIGPMGRLIDNHWTFMLLFALEFPICFAIGLGIGWLL